MIYKSIVRTVSQYQISVSSPVSFSLFRLFITSHCLLQLIRSFEIMFALSFLGASALFWTFSLANLDKPPLHPNLDYLNQGLIDNLHAPSYTLDEWGSGWIAEDCATMASGAKLNPADVHTYNVHYADVCNPFHSSCSYLTFRSAAKHGSSAGTRTAPAPSRT
jgi:hypothetical protein